MAIQETSIPFTHNAQDVGNAFVGQYYHVLHSSPKMVYQFYQETSQLSRLDSNGTMTTVTTLDAINDMIISLNYEDCRAEIETADSQDSYEKGVIVLVTGCLTGNDNVQKKFVQTFFLAPQSKGIFYVKNDVLRFVNENKPLDVHEGWAHSIEENDTTAPLAPKPVPGHVSDHHMLDSVASIEEEKEDFDTGAEVYDSSDNEGSIEEDLVEPSTPLVDTSTHLVEPSTHADQNETPTRFETAPTSQVDAPKKSYASIVKVMKGSTTSIPVRVPTSNARLAAAVPDRQSHVSAKPAPQTGASTPTVKSVLENFNAHEEAACHSIYIKNLPLDATVKQVGDALIRFGPIKRGGIQVRSNKGFCFGFVEFESMSSMQSAIEASPIALGDRQIHIEEKKTTTRVGSGGRGRFNSGRGGFRNENFRSQGNFGGGGGRGYGRNENRNQGEFSGRPRASSGRNGEGHQRVNQNGSGWGGHSQDGTDYTSVPI